MTKALSVKLTSDDIWLLRRALRKSIQAEKKLKRPRNKLIEERETMVYRLRAWQALLRDEVVIVDADE